MTETTPPADPVITLDHVSKSYGGFLAVDDADFSVGRNEFFALLGPSGCGKTTTLRMVAGFDHPTDGRVLLDGRDVSSVPPHRRPVNTVFQQYALFPHMSVFDNVAYGPRSRKLSEREVAAKVHEMLDVVRLADLARRKPAQLSGGQQQRVALARALVNLPRALLLDEPLGALDQKLRHAMQIELKRIQREVGIAFVFVTHDQEEALTMSDRIAVMNGGRVEQIGSPTDIYRQPASVFVAGFIGQANLLPAAVSSVNGTGVMARLLCGPEVIAHPNGRSFRSGDQVTVVLRPEELTLTRLAPEHPHALQVHVRDLVFQGNRVRTNVLAGDGTALTCELLPDAAAEIRVAEPMWLSWSSDDAYVLPGAPAHAGATGIDVDAVEAAL